MVGAASPCGGGGPARPHWAYVTARSERTSLAELQRGPDCPACDKCPPWRWHSEFAPPDRTADEFATLLAHNDLGPDDFAELLPRRSPGAIGAVRSGVHAHHTGGDESLLSGSIRRYLVEQDSELMCPMCGKKLGE